MYFDRTVKVYKRLFNLYVAFKYNPFVNSFQIMEPEWNSLNGIFYGNFIILFKCEMCINK